jgi:hypothetical protein
MADFNYKNAYKLAIQTNRELHAALETYKSLLAAMKAELDEVKAENKELKYRIEGLEK